MPPCRAAASWCTMSTNRGIRHIYRSLLVWPSQTIRSCSTDDDDPDITFSPQVSSLVPNELSQRGNEQHDSFKGEWVYSLPPLLLLLSSLFSCNRVRCAKLLKYRVEKKKTETTAKKDRPQSAHTSCKCYFWREWAPDVCSCCCCTEFTSKWMTEVSK